MTSEADREAPAALEQELQPLSRFGRSNAIVDESPDFQPTPLLHKGRTQSLMFNVKRINSLPAKFLQRPSIVTPTETHADDKSLDETLRQFCRTITGEETLTGQIQRSWVWYIEQYLQGHIAQAWQPIIVPVIEGLSPDSCPTAPASKILVFQVLNQISQFMSGVEDTKITLHNLEVHLRRRKLIRASGDGAATRELAIQFIFQVTGWLAAFWDPALDASTTDLSLAQRNDGLTQRRRITMHSPSITSTCTNMSEAKHDLSRLLSRFGTLLPEPKVIVRDPFRGGAEAGPEELNTTYLTLYNLSEDLHLDVKWTNTLNQHLEYDQAANTLSIFRFPSICHLQSRKGHSTLLAHTFREWTDEQNRWTADAEKYRHHPSSPSPLDSPAARRVRRGIKIEDYLIEVLLSYDIIFGRCAKSRAMAKTVLLWGQLHDQWRADGQFDPLLELLCTRGQECPEVAELMEELQAGKQRETIFVDEYPFLGERLAILHARSVRQGPHTWSRLWNDRRNRSAWMALWAVIVFGGGTLLLQALQLVFQGFQTWPV